MPDFGRNSTSQLVTMHHDLQILATDVVEIYDISIEQGRRTIPEQIANIRRKVSKTIDSRHIPRDAEGNYDPNAPCIAGDFIPYQKGINPWPQPDEPRVVQQKKARRFYYMQGIFLAMAHKHDIPIIGGVDWDGDGDFFDQSFDDMPHVQLAIKLPKLIVPADLLDMANEALTSRGLPEYKNAA